MRGAAAPTVVVIGAGIGGLAAAIDLAAHGVEVTVLERAASPGGKMRQVSVDGAQIDAGPTVFTMRWVFEALFADAGAALGAAVTLRPAEALARHAWQDGGRLDLFADIDRSCTAIGAFAGASAARGYADFCTRARRAFDVLDAGFMRDANPSMTRLLRAAGPRGIAALVGLAPWTSLWRALGRDFRDPRLRQLFARYATYCGASPFQAPATLMLIAHVEREGVWLVEGGMHRLALALADLAKSLGVSFRYVTEVQQILIANGQAAGVRLATGERLGADAVVLNADVAALAGGLLGAGAAEAAPRADVARRSLSAVTWALHAETAGFPLLRHNVFFSRDYAAEFADIFGAARLPAEPTVYVCAQDRGDDDGSLDKPERLLCLVNAPARGDTHPFTAAEIAQCEARTFALMENCGLRIRRRAEASMVTTPNEFAALFPATGGALYGAAMHGTMAAFRRPTAQTRMPGLYLAGGSVHPGAGIPMAAMSGRMAAARLLADFASTKRSHQVATPGGMSMPSAMTAPMDSR
jgi:1-hydroxycarotenoid 3,4-desaturase